MNKLLFGIFLIFFAFLLINLANAKTKGKTWVVIVAGFDGPTGQFPKIYAIQSSAYRAYHLFRDGGIPKEKIILFSLDDLAFDEGNPSPGVVLNGAPLMDNARNYYEDVQVDYGGEKKSCTSGILEFVLLNGNKETASVFGSGKVLESGPSDTIIFVLFGINHEGQFYMGNLGYDFIRAHQLAEYFDILIEKKKAKKILVYLETREAATYFDNLVDGHNNILAISAGDRESDIYLCAENSLLKQYTSLCRTEKLFNRIEELRKGKYKDGKTLLDLINDSKHFSEQYKHYNKFGVYGQLEMLNDKIEDYFGVDNTGDNEMAETKENNTVTGNSGAGKMEEMIIGRK